MDVLFPSNPPAFPIIVADHQYMFMAPGNNNSCNDANSNKEMRYKLPPNEDARVYRYLVGKNGTCIRSLEKDLNCRLEIRDKAHPPYIRVHLTKDNYNEIQRALDDAIRKCREYVKYQWHDPPSEVPMEENSTIKALLERLSISEKRVEDLEKAIETIKKAFGPKDIK